MPAQGSGNELGTAQQPHRLLADPRSSPQPVMRSAWIEKRKGQANVSQMHYARQGVITEEMAHVAKRENLPESLVMEEVARPGLGEQR